MLVVLNGGAVAFVSQVRKRLELMSRTTLGIAERWHWPHHGKGMLQALATRCQSYSVDIRRLGALLFMRTVPVGAVCN